MLRQASRRAALVRSSSVSVRRPIAKERGPICLSGSGEGLEEVIVVVHGRPHGWSREIPCECSELRDEAVVWMEIAA